MDLQKRFGRGAVLSGLTHECGVFGAMACGEWPTQVSLEDEIGHILSETQRMLNFIDL